MLCLSRKENERVLVIIPAGTIIPPDGMVIAVTLVELRGDKARLGFDAPPDIPIHRKEVWDKIKEGTVNV